MLCVVAKLSNQALLETDCFALLLNASLLRRIFLWHLRHLRPMSAPALTTSHSQLPQGCALRKRITSPSFMSILIDLVADFFSYVSSRLGEILFPGGIKNLPGHIDNRLLAPGIHSVGDC
jgi:hypothetical protein